MFVLFGKIKGGIIIMANDILQIITIILLGLSIIVMWIRDLKNNTSIKRDNGLLFDIITTLLFLELILTVISK
jgi:hypothetical protein